MAARRGRRLACCSKPSNRWKKASCCAVKRAAERLLLQMGITFNVYGDSAGTERIFPFDLIPRIVARRGMGLDRARPQAAHPRAQRVHRRHLPRAENPEGQNHSRGDHPFRRVLPPAMPRHQSSAARLVPHHRHGSGSPRRRPNLRAGRQSARALGRFLRPGKPRADEAHVPPRLCRPARPPGGHLPQQAAGDVGIHRAPPAADNPTRGAAHARHVQLRLFRAQFSGAADGHSIGGGPRPGGAGRRASACAPPRGCGGWT